MQLFIKTLSGQQFIIDAQPTDTIASLKTQIHQTKKIPLDQIALSFGGEQLEDTKTLGDYDIRYAQTINFYPMSYGKGNFLRAMDVSSK